MSWKRNSVLSLATLIILQSRWCPAAETGAELILVPPATPPFAASVEVVSEPTVADLALHQYFYVDFPRAIQALANERAIAEAELTLIARRVNGYRPFRSFKQYGATYTVDQSWQIALLAAQQRLECLQNDEADLWRQRHAVAAAFVAQSPSP